MKKITLTFDNGPERGVTEGVLDVLKRHGIKATFFVLGSKVAQPEGRALAERAVGEGHWVGNHTFTHTRPLGELDRNAALREFEMAEQALSWAPLRPRLFRPFGGGGTLGRHLLNSAVVEKLQAGEYTCVLWNCVPGDWNDAEGWVARAIGECDARQWSLVVLHDIGSGAMAHLEEFIERMRGEGFTFTQEFPPECLPIVAGEIRLPLEPYVTVVL
jgi:peptidoglycan-N-acetylglucosamine deacetylase